MKKDNTLAELITGIILLGMIEQIICLIFLKDYLYNAIGVWSGAAIAIGMVIHMKRSIEDALDLGEEGAVKHMRKTYALRLTVVAIVMGCIIYFGLGNPFTLLAGALTLKISAYLQPYMHKIFTRKSK